MTRWDDIGHHLVMIESGADIAKRHADRLLERPNWETLAEDELAKAEQVLLNALHAVQAARAAIGSKDIARVDS